MDKQTATFVARMAQALPASLCKEEMQYWIDRPSELVKFLLGLQKKIKGTLSNPINLRIDCDTMNPVEYLSTRSLWNSSLINSLRPEDGRFLVSFLDREMRFVITMEASDLPSLITELPEKYNFRGDYLHFVTLIAFAIRHNERYNLCLDRSGENFFFFDTPDGNKVIKVTYEGSFWRVCDIKPDGYATPINSRVFLPPHEE